jgi:hypothetical protein
MNYLLKPHQNMRFSMKTLSKNVSETPTLCSIKAPCVLIFNYQRFRAGIWHFYNFRASKATPLGTLWQVIARYGTLWHTVRVTFMHGMARYDTIWHDMVPKWA